MFLIALAAFLEACHTDTSFDCEGFRPLIVKPQTNPRNNDSPYLREHHGRKPRLHEEASGLGPSDEPVLGAHSGELLHVPHPLLGQDHPWIHLDSR